MFGVVAFGAGLVVGPGVEDELAVVEISELELELELELLVEVLVSAGAVPCPLPSPSSFPSPFLWSPPLAALQALPILPFASCWSCWSQVFFTHASALPIIFPFEQ